MSQEEVKVGAVKVGAVSQEAVSQEAVNLEVVNLEEKAEEAIKKAIKNGKKIHLLKRKGGTTRKRMEREGMTVRKETRTKRKKKRWWMLLKLVQERKILMDLKAVRKNQDGYKVKKLINR